MWCVHAGVRGLHMWVMDERMDGICDYASQLLLSMHADLFR